MITRAVHIEATPEATVSGLLNVPEDFRRGVTPGLILAHGQNNDMHAPLLATVAEYLASTGKAVVMRFNFPYMERGDERPDSGPILQAAYRRAHDALVDDDVYSPGPVFLGGKSLGARIAAELASRGPEAEGLLAAGLVFLGFPLHAPGRRDNPRLEPLRRIHVPSLFLVGTRDPFCDLALLKEVVAGLDRPGRIHVVEGGNHSFEVAASAGRSQDEVYAEIGEETARFIEEASRTQPPCEYPT